MLVLTLDEDNFSPANHIPMVGLGPPVRPGRFAQRVDHFNALSTLAQGLGIEPLTGASPVEGVLVCSPPSPQSG